MMLSDHTDGPRRASPGPGPAGGTVAADGCDYHACVRDTGGVAQQRSTFAKLQREREKKEKAVAKAGRRAEKAAAAAEASVAGPAPDNEAAILAALAELHAAYDNGSVSSDEFEDRRDQLRQQLQVG